MMSAILGLYWAVEAEDIKLGELLLKEDALQKQDARISIGGSSYGKSSSHYVFSFYVLQFVSFTRFYVQLYSLTSAVTMVILKLGSDAVSLIFNALAAAFVLELDNIIYAQGLPRSTSEHLKNVTIEVSQDFVSKASAARHAHIFFVAVFIQKEIIFASRGRSAPVFVHWLLWAIYLIWMTVREVGVNKQGLRSLAKKCILCIAGYFLMIMSDGLTSIATGVNPNDLQEGQREHC
jgi:hypothetical protein